MLVLDASVVVELVIPTTDAGAILDRIARPAESLHAPYLLDVEVAQVLRRFVRAGQLTDAQGRQALDRLIALPIVRYAHAPLLARMWPLRENLTAYDAAYMTLAEALGAPVRTRDHRLAASPGIHARVELI